MRPLCPSCPKTELEGERTLTAEKVALSQAPDGLWTRVITSDGSVWWLSAVVPASRESRKGGPQIQCWLGGVRASLGNERLSQNKQ